jgi:alpha-L-fucosidase
MTMVRSVFASIVLVGTCIFWGDFATAEDQQPDENVPAASPDALARWREMRFGMFVHWGSVSLKGTEIGWSRQGPRRGRARAGTGTVPMEEYDNLYRQFYAGYPLVRRSGQPARAVG